MPIKHSKVGLLWVEENPRGVVASRGDCAFGALCVSLEWDAFDVIDKTKIVSFVLLYIVKH